MADERLTTLSYAVRGKVVAKYLGQLGLMVAALTLVPAGVALGYGETGLAVRFATVALLLAATAAPVLRLPAPERVQTNEALAIIALVFVLTPLAMSWPLMAAGLSFPDALFEAVSGVTTTGLSTVQRVVDMPRGFLFARAWMQWYGGLGIVALAVPLLMGHPLAARRLTELGAGETLVTTTRSHTRRMLAVYLTLTGTGIAVLWLTGLDPFAAVAQTLAAVSTGGFSTFDHSLADLPAWHSRLAVVLVATLGAVPLPLYWRVRQHGRREAFGDMEVRALVLGSLGVATALTLLLHRYDGLDWAASAGHGLLLGLSAQTTTGFSSLDPGHLDPAARLVMIAAMAVGGGLGSTAGGVKLLRMLILLRLFQLAVRRTALPSHGVVAARLGGHALDNEDLVRALVVIGLFGAVVALSWLPFVAAGYDPLDALFEVVSATATVGLSTGITHAGLSLGLKGVLALDMLLGRLEIVAVLVLLYPGTWFGKRTETQ